MNKEKEKFLVKYIIEGSPSEMNVSSKTRKRTEEVLKKSITEENFNEWKSNFYTETDYLISELETNLYDPFGRFVNNKLFKDLTKEILDPNFLEKPTKMVFGGVQGETILNSGKSWTIKKDDPLGLVLSTLSEFKLQFKKEEFWNEDKSFNFDKFTQSSFYLSYLFQNVTGLQDIEISQLKENERLAFFINVYNLLFLHGFMSIHGNIQNVVDRNIFMKNIHYKIAGMNFSLDYILNGILKNSSSGSGVPDLFGILKKDDLKKKYAFSSVIPEVFFSLIDFTKTSPDLDVINPTDIESQLKEKTSKYIQKYLITNDDILMVPTLFADNKKEISQGKKESFNISVMKFLMKYNVELKGEYEIETYGSSKGDCSFLAPNHQLVKKDSKKKQQMMKDVSSLDQISQETIRGYLLKMQDKHQGIIAQRKKNKNEKTFSSEEMLNWLKTIPCLEKETDENILKFMNELNQRRLLAIVNGSSPIINDKNQVLLLQPDFLPLAFETPILISELSYKKNLFSTQKTKAFLFKSGLALFDDEKLLNVYFIKSPAVAYISKAKGNSFSFEGYPYLKMDFSVKDEGELKKWMESFKETSVIFR